VTEPHSQSTSSQTFDLADNILLSGLIRFSWSGITNQAQLAETSDREKSFITFPPGNIIFLRSDGVAKPLPAYEVTFCHYGLVQWG
jgi:hypothetical protein